MKITITTKPISEMRFTTAGDWLQHDDGSYEIQLVETPDARYWWIVLLHEMVEFAWCQWKGISAKEADEFDALWEAEIELGMQRPEVEAGFDPRCPYRGGHELGAMTERIMCACLGVDWDEYNDYWDSFFRNMVESRHGKI
jgi:hypothetical protein